MIDTLKCMCKYWYFCFWRNVF